VVVPFSTVVKMPDDVDFDSVSPTETKFTFSSPVYLEPGEYAICVLANSRNYRLFAAQSGINTVNNNEAVAARAGNNQKVGTLFVPQGIGPASEINNIDLMFAVNRCEFTASGTIRWKDVPSVSSSQIISVHSSELIPNSCLMFRSLSGLGFKNNETLYPTRLFSGSVDMTYDLVRGSDVSVSPVVDSSTLSVAAIKMNPVISRGGVSRYVSRVVELPSDLSSNGIAVFLDANVPVFNSSVRVYYRAVSDGESLMFYRPWIEMERITPAFVSSSEIDFREIEFRGQTTNTNNKFNAYQIAVELVSPTDNVTYGSTPSARNIKTVSYIVP
jgi:hypothetical protein